MARTFPPSSQNDSAEFRSLQPSLLDRLTMDDHRQSIGRAITPDEFKESLRRDLEWVFKARCQPNYEDLERDYPLLASSAMNYGLPTFRDDTLSSLRTGEVLKRFRKAILRFENRIRPESLRVVVPDDLLSIQRVEGGCVLHVVIEGEAAGFPETLIFRAQVNVATGDCSIGDERRA